METEHKQRQQESQHEQQQEPWSVCSLYPELDIYKMQLLARALSKALAFLVFTVRASLKVKP